MEASCVSIDVFCMVILLFFFFGLAISASEEEYFGYPRKIVEPNSMLRTPYSRGYVGVSKEEEE